jgi:hypothetical protein
MEKETIESTSKFRKSEEGGAGAKLVIVLVILFLVGHAGFNYIPVAYQGEALKQELQTSAVQASAAPNLTGGSDSLKAKVRRIADGYGVPPNALIDVKTVNGIVSVHVKYSHEVDILPFGIYRYNYQFDNTATPTGFLTKQ